MVLLLHKLLLFLLQHLKRRLGLAVVCTNRIVVLFQTWVFAGVDAYTVAVLYTFF